MGCDDVRAAARFGSFAADAGQTACRVTGIRPGRTGYSRVGNVNRA
jgi:hypothetical protein